MRVAILGASGFVGQYLQTALEERGDDVVAASLRDPAAAASAVAGCQTIVNLAGEPIAQRWNERVKQRLLESRINAPQRFLEALASCEQRPSTYVSASAIGYYGTSEIAEFVEDSLPGNDFLAQMCVAWEAQANNAATLGMHVAIIRTGIVLATDGGMLAKMLPAFRFGLGGKIGSGKQWISWIHVADLVAMYLSAIDSPGGVLNATAPNPVTNEVFTQTLASALRRPAFATVPPFALQAMFGEGAGVIATGQRVLPMRAEKSGFSFAYPSLPEALDALVNPNSERA